MTKKRTRENLYLMLFQTEFYQEQDLMEQADLFLESLEGKDATEKAKEALRERYQSVLSHLSEIDEKIGQKAEGWSFSRLPKADLSVMRLAVYEILYDEDVPDGVAINEAVELAKRYGGDKSFRFVNGVLASVVKERSV
ncbi:MAG: transcription antitermination factor NusB [Lachnospiraceae bacterium]|nr:transcription antitermination factor NusB [Lachnospiraceae bacterium]